MDAGGKGLVVVLDGLVEVLTGEVHIDDVSDEVIVAHEPMPHGEYTGPRYEVMYLLDAEDVGIPALRSRLDALGDSLVVVGGGGLWNVHVHTDSIGAAIEAGIDAGRPHRIAVTDLIEQQRHQPREITRVVVAVAHGPGVAELLEESGAVAVRTPPRAGQHARLRPCGHTSGARARRCCFPPMPIRHPWPRPPRSSCATMMSGCRRAQPFDRADAVRSGGARCNRRLRRRRGDHGPGVQRNPLRRGDGGQQRKRSRLPGGVRWATFWGWSTGTSWRSVTRLMRWPLRIIDRMRSSTSELVTLVTGSEVPDDLVDMVGAHLQDALLDLEVVPGGQPFWPVIVGVE